MQARLGRKYQNVPSACVVQAVVIARERHDGFTAAVVCSRYTRERCAHESIRVTGGSTAHSVQLSRRRQLASETMQLYY